MTSEAERDLAECRANPALWAEVQRLCTEYSKPEHAGFMFSRRQIEDRAVDEVLWTHRRQREFWEKRNSRRPKCRPVNQRF